MLSSAEKQAEAIADVERIAGKFYEAVGRHGWNDIGDELRERYRGAITELLHADVIRVGRRPHVDRPMTGQTRIDDDLSGAEMLHGEALRGGGQTHIAREALDDLYRPRDRHHE